MNAERVRKAKFVDAYSNYYSLIYSVICSKVSDTNQADDICQEVFLRLYEKIDEVNDHRKWLYGTMRLVFLEYYRKNRNDSVDPESLFADASMSFVNGFRDSRIIIEQALEDTANYGTTEDRTLFDLIALYNHSYAEAAAELGISERQARYRYGLVNNRLMEYFRQRGIKGLEDLL